MTDPHDDPARAFERALELEGPAREAFLSELAPQLADRVRALLRADAASGALDRPASGAAFAAPGEDRTAPETIGGLRVLGEIGRGGMGVVYEAEQLRPRRTVAVKLLRGAFVDARVRRRFELEGELLARLDHPGIARVFATGDDDGRPYLVMERVRGGPIDAWADARGLDREARIALVARVADAVAHAHERGVLHRDLKPANVLVTDDGAPVVLDFGIARAIERDGDAESLATRAGELWGTLATMAPEQAEGARDAVGTPTDVYALGALAYRLLTGSFPHDLEGLTLATGLARVAEGRVRRPSELAPGLGGDLETVLLHALERDPARRYASAAEFARDLRRVLAHEPIAARPPTAGYQLARFARRHRAWVAGTALTLAAILLGAAVSLALYLESESRGRRLAAALDEAQEATERAEARTEELLAAERFFDQMLTEASPFADGSQARVVDALERTVARLDEFQAGPAARARLMRRVGETLLALDRREQARGVLAESLALTDADDPARPAVEAKLAALDWDEREDEVALEGLRRAVEAAEAHDHLVLPARLRLERAWIDALTTVSRVEEADRAVEHALALAVDATPREQALTELSAVQTDLAAGRLDAAIGRARGAIATLAETDGPRSLEVLQAEQLLSVALYYVSDYDAALALAERNLETIEGLVDGPHAALLGPLETICVVQIERRALGSAREAIDRALAIAGALKDLDTVTYANLLVQRAGVHEYSGRVDEAFDDYARAVETLEPGAPNLTLVSALAQMGALHLREGRPGDAIGPLAESAELHEALIGPDDLRLGWTLRALGQAQGRVADFEAALGSHERELAITEQHLELTGPVPAMEAAASVGETLLNLGRDAEALAVLEQREPLADDELAEPTLSAFRLQLGAARLRAGDPAAAETVRRAAMVLAGDADQAPRAARRLEELGTR